MKMDWPGRRYFYCWLPSLGKKGIVVLNTVCLSIHVSVLSYYTPQVFHVPNRIWCNCITAESYWLWPIYDKIVNFHRILYHSLNVMWPCCPAAPSRPQYIMWLICIWYWLFFKRYLGHLSLGWLDVFSLFPLCLLRQPPQQLLPLTSKLS